MTVVELAKQMIKEEGYQVFDYKVGSFEGAITFNMNGIDIVVICTEGATCLPDGTLDVLMIDFHTATKDNLGEAIKVANQINNKHPVKAYTDTDSLTSTLSRRGFLHVNNFWYIVDDLLYARKKFIEKMRHYDDLNKLFMKILSC